MSSDKGKAKVRELDSCAICLEPVSERAIAVPCNHVSFDFVCLASWLQSNQTCPLCKTQLTAVEYDWRSPHDYKTYNLPQHPPPPPAEPSSSRQHSHSQWRPHSHRRGPLPPPRPIPNLTLAAAVRRRKYVYAHRLFSAHVGTNRVSQYRDMTPSLFQKSPQLQSRARAFLRRELLVFDFLSPDHDGSEAEHATRATRAQRRAQNAEFVLEYVVSLLKTVDARGAAGRAADMVGELLGARDGRLLVHELLAWLRSPYERLEDWDRHVQYPPPLVRGEGARPD